MNQCSKNTLNWGYFEHLKSNSTLNQDPQYDFVAQIMQQMIKITKFFIIGIIWVTLNTFLDFFL